MTNDVRQWLAEIKALQQKLAEAHQERDEAYASAANWRSLYETEAKQRRMEATAAQQSIAALKAELLQLQAFASGEDTDASDLEAAEQEVAQFQTLDELREELIKALAERDRLAQALKAEQESHLQTRKGLTTALGDTVDMLAKERAARSNGEHASLGGDRAKKPSPQIAGSTNGSSYPEHDMPKTPLPELPLLDQVQSQT